MTLDGLEKLIRTTLTGLLRQTPCTKCGGETSVLQAGDNVSEGSIFIHEAVKRLVRTWHLPENMSEEKVRALAMKATKRRLRKEMAQELEELLLATAEKHEAPYREIRDSTHNQFPPDPPPEEDLERETIFTPISSSEFVDVNEVIAESEGRVAEGFGEAAIPDFAAPANAREAVPPSSGIPKGSVQIPVCGRCGKDIFPGQPCGCAS